MPSQSPAKRLKKELGLFDVYAVSVGAMFSSGFFLLPGLAAAQAGPSVVLAYLLAGLLMLPSLFSLAELATAMPRAGGSYYFLDRSLGPVAGTIGGLGTWLALLSTGAFALIGMGAYLALFVDLPITPVAVALTVLFMLLNLSGAKETTGLQGVLVATLVGIMLLFVAQGLIAVFGMGIGEVHRTRFTPLLPNGLSGFAGAVGFVFVSYAGLTKAASIAEEVREPDRVIPRAMLLALLTATLLYGAGVYIMVAVLEPAQLHTDLTPAASAGEQFLRWLPRPAGLLLVVIAAIAAFASTANAAILAASRYPLAMARDRLLPARLAEISGLGTPLPAVLTTALAMIVLLLVLDAEGVVRLASAFQLLTFAGVNLAVIVMRESRIESYDPAYRVPFYPWMPALGCAACLLLLAQLGPAPILFAVVFIVFCLFWYRFYARRRVARTGAIYHIFARLGQHRFDGLDRELRGILKEKGLREEDPFDDVVARAFVMDVGGDTSFEEVAWRAADLLAQRVPVRAQALARGFTESTRLGATPLAGDAALPHLRLAEAERPEMVLVRAPGMPVEVGEETTAQRHETRPVSALFFLVSPEANPGLHLRILAEIAGRLEEGDFMTAWRAAEGEQALREVLLRNERFLSLRLLPGSRAGALIGRPLREVEMPEGSLVALVRRGADMIVPRGSTVLREGDRLTIIGEPKGIHQLHRLYGDTASP